MWYTFVYCTVSDLTGWFLWWILDVKWTDAVLVHKVKVVDSLTWSHWQLKTSKAEFSCILELNWIWIDGIYNSTVTCEKWFLFNIKHLTHSVLGWVGVEIWTCGLWEQFCLCQCHQPSMWVSAGSNPVCCMRAYCFNLTDPELIVTCSLLLSVAVF